MPWDALSNPYGNGFKVGTKVRVICSEGAGQGKPFKVATPQRSSRHSLQPHPWRMGRDATLKAQG